jgi:hypothetical protein
MAAPLAHHVRDRRLPPLIPRANKTLGSNLAVLVIFVNMELIRKGQINNPHPHHTRGSGPFTIAERSPRQVAELPTSYVSSPLQDFSVTG